METTYITLTELCEGYKIEHKYIKTLTDYGLIELELYEGHEALDTVHLPKLEKIIRFNEDLHINFEGIEVILNLLEKIEAQKRDLLSLKNKLHIYQELTDKY